jgi:hypothetical protein
MYHRHLFVIHASLSRSRPEQFEMPIVSSWHEGSETTKEAKAYNKRTPGLFKVEFEVKAIYALCSKLYVFGNPVYGRLAPDCCCSEQGNPHTFGCGYIGLQPSVKRARNMFAFCPGVFVCSGVRCAHILTSLFLGQDVFEHRERA